MTDLLKNIEVLNTGSKISFLCIGDIHLYHNSPSSRLDDYSKTCIEKLQFIFDYSINNDINCIIITGDVFNKINIPYQYLNLILNCIKKYKEEFFKKNNRITEIYSIIGNHDLPYDNFNYFDRSPLYTLMQIGIIKHLNKLKLENNDKKSIQIKGFDYSNNPVKSECNNEVCVLHCFFDYPQDEDNLTKKQAKELGYNLYICGHDHLEYKPYKTSSYTVLRSGSLLRTSSLLEQINRIPIIYYVEYNTDEKKYNYDKINIDVAKEGQFIFSEESLAKPEKSSYKSDVTSHIHNIISAMNEKQSNNATIDELLALMNLDKDVYDVLKKYLKNV